MTAVLYKFVLMRHFHSQYTKIVYLKVKLLSSSTDCWPRGWNSPIKRRSDTGEDRGQTGEKEA